ncbi:MAG: hypothetical protein LBN07_03570 [Christensenellaceae bacterium]|jgi:hypothetical protein|nr:hypothetical protein [Christensenellaceae bacterium]
MSIGINKRLIACVVAVITFIAMQLGALFYGLSSPILTADAYSKTISISNGDFKNYTGSVPYTPSSWSSAKDGSSSEGLKIGVIDINNVSDLGNLSNASFARDTRPDPYVLMIQSQNGDSSYGYKNSSSVQLSANSYFKVSVDVKTITGNNGASIYLSGVTPEENINSNQYSFINVVSKTSVYPEGIYNEWDTFTFWVETATTKASSMTLELWLGSRNNIITSHGSVLFDSVSVVEIGQSDFYNYVNNEFDPDNTIMAKHNRIIQLKEGLLTGALNNGDFEQGLVGWQLDQYGDIANVRHGVANINSGSETRNILGLESTDTIPGNTGTYGNQKAMYISNLEPSFLSYITTDTNSITIEQFSFYRIGIWAKAGKLDGGNAWAKLTEIIPGDDPNPERTPLSHIISDINSNSGAESKNGYQEYVFYVQGSPFKNIEVSLTLGLGNAGSLVSGYVIFDDITVEQISGETFSQINSGNELNFNTSTDTTDILNGKFDFVNSKTIQTVYPLAPSNWTSDQNNANSGIVNLNSTHWANNAAVPGHGYGTVTYPGTIGYYGTESNPAKTQNNVLMLRNTETTSLQFKSSTFSVTASYQGSTSYTAVELYMQTQYVTEGVDLEITTDEGFALCAIYDIVTNNQWTKYTLLIKNTSKDFSANLHITLNGTGYAFVDYIKVTRTDGTMLRDSLSSFLNPPILNETLFAQFKQSSSQNVMASDLDVDSFSYFGRNISSGLYNSQTFSAEPQSGVIAGVVDLTAMGIPQKENENPYALMIQNNFPTHFNYTSNITYYLNAGSFYKFSVWVYTQNIIGEVIPHEEEVEGDFGVYISISGIDQQFKGIKTKNSAEEGYNSDKNGWENYLFYVKATSSISATLTLSLGNEYFPTQGYAFFDDATMQLSDEATYKSFIVDPDAAEEDITFKTTDSSGAHLMFGQSVSTAPPDEGGPTDESGDTEGDTPPSNGDNLFIIIPSILIVVAIIIALVGYVLRRVNLKMPIRKKKAASYNRKGTLEEELIRKELAAVRAEKVKNIDSQLKALESVVEENKAAYETAVASETNKAKAEKMFNKYAKERNALQRQIDNLVAAKTYITDEANIKLEENKEMHRRSAELEAKNKQIQKEAEKEAAKKKK